MATETTKTTAMEGLAGWLQARPACHAFDIVGSGCSLPLKLNRLTRNHPSFRPLHPSKDAIKRSLEWERSEKGKAHH